MGVRTYLDSGVLISAWRGNPARKIRALTILSDPHREFICSPFVKLELLLKPLSFKLQAEVEFYEDYFRLVKDWVEAYEAMYAEAMDTGARYGLGAIDALHIAAARLAGAAEFITAERPASPLSRVHTVKVLTIY